ncbi:MAG: hypothetical protein KKA05_09270, partial [Alphaproteobacteria bacterium]|nr:hypothetical protein [Alphaproteobacteria bacterium]
FAPLATNVTIGLAGASGTLNLTATELDYIGADWDNVIFGRIDGTATLAVNSRTWNHNLTLQTASGTLSIAGANMGDNNLTLSTNSNLSIGNNLSGTGNLIIKNSSGLTNIAVGTGQSGTVLLDNTELLRIVDGWNNVTIGSTQSFGNINIAANNWVNPMHFVTQGDIVINGAQTTTETTGTTLVYATTGGNFINNAGADAIDPGGGRYLVYSVAEANDTLDGLVRPTILTDVFFTDYGPAAVTETGNVYIYSGLAAKILFLSIDDVEKIYGDANPVFTYSYIGGLQNGDLLSDIVLSYSMTAPGSTILDDAGTMRTINGTFTLSNGYGLNLIAGTLTVAKATVTVTADSDSRQYGVANPGLTVSYDGLKNGDDESVFTDLATATTAATILSDVGTYAITADGASADNYDFIYVDGSLNITKATLNATVQNTTREYGDANPAFNIVYSGFRNGDTIGVINTTATATTAATALSNVGNYVITGAGAVDNNYAFNYINGTLSVTKAMLTATADDATRIYGDANPALTVSYSGFKNSDTSSVLNTQAVATTAATVTTGAGTAAIVASGAADDNYNFTYVDGALTISKALLTVTADNQTKTYGDANPAFTASYSGFKNSETVTDLITNASATTAADLLSSVGTYSIAASGATSNNYDFAYVDGVLSIGKATLNATVQNATREYGDVNPAFNIVYTGFRNGDTEGHIDSMAAVSTAATLTSDVGNYVITGAGGTDNNYDFNYIDGTLAITKAMLTATANNASRIYGDANPALTVSYSGFKNSENSGVLNTHATASTAATTATGAGTAIITASGGGDNNYDFAYVDGTLTISKALLTVTANNQNKIYGDANPVLTVSYSGFKNNETETHLTTAANATTAADILSGAGNYAITAAGGAADNYDFAYVDGVLNIGKATLTATASSDTRVYGDSNPAFTVSYAGFRNADVITDIDTLAAASSVGSTANVGDHAVIAAGGIDDNYTFDYVDGVLSITKALLTATADDATRAVGEANPAFTLTYAGFRNGENSSVIDSDPTASTLADNGSTAGDYIITLAGGLDNNYDFDYVDGVLTLTAVVAPPAPLPPPPTPTAPPQKNVS